MIEYLHCPLCDEPAIASDEEGLFNEDMENPCPGCGEPLRANITGDGEREWIEAICTREDLVDG